jgi:hypothetical protein
MATVVPMFTPGGGGGPGFILGGLLFVGLVGAHTVYRSIPQYQLKAVKKQDTFTVEITDLSTALIKDIHYTTTGVNCLERKGYIRTGTYILDDRKFTLTKNTTIEQFRVDCKECAVKSEVSVLYNNVFDTYQPKKQELDWSKCKVAEMK